MCFKFVLETAGVNHPQKKPSSRKLIEIKETLHVCDVQRIRNPKHSSVLIQWWVVYIFTSENTQELNRNTEIFNAFSSYHSRVMCSVPSRSPSFKKGSGLWKSNNSLIQNQDYILRLTLQLKILYKNWTETFIFVIKWNGNT